MQSLPTTLPKFFWRFVRRYLWQFALIYVCCLAWSLDHIAWPQVIRAIINTLQTYAGPREEIWHIISGVVMLGAVLWLTIEFGFRAGGILMAKVIPQVESDIRTALFDYTMGQSHTYFANNYPGNLANKINDMPRCIHEILVMLATVFVPAAVTTMFMTIFFVQISPFLGLILFGWVFLHIGVCLFTAGKCQSLSSVHAEARSRLAGYIVDSFMNNMLVRIFARKSYELQLMSVNQVDEKNKNSAAMIYIEKIKIFLGILCFLCVGVGFTALQIHHYKIGLIDLGDLIFTFQGAVNVTMITWWAGMELPRLFQNIGVCQQALTIAQAPIQIVDKPGACDIEITKGKIVFENVTFRYESGHDIFHNQSITIQPGEKVGLVGFSGGGKTTFVNLILRYFDIHGGSILIDGQNIADVTQDSLRRQIAMIPQEAMMFHRSIMENIRYGDLSSSDARVIEAAKKARCHEFIQKLKEKYDTIAGDRGFKISGGQRQRIAIARAVLKQSPILIMDEATSALDSITENDIQESIKEIAEGRTTLIIAHRLSTLADMDRILVFKEGKIVEDGTHNELYDLGGHYRELWDMQVDGFLPDDDEDEI
jgi:ATP-binding cassette subfamily B protein